MSTRSHPRPARASRHAGCRHAKQARRLEPAAAFPWRPTRQHRLPDPLVSTEYEDPTWTQRSWRSLCLWPSRGGGGRRCGPARCWSGAGPSTRSQSPSEDRDGDICCRAAADLAGEESHVASQDPGGGRRPRGAQSDSRSLRPVAGSPEWAGPCPSVGSDGPPGATLCSVLTWGLRETSKGVCSLWLLRKGFCLAS